MSQFIQFHMLVSYPPSNLNRDDLGRPKTALVGGVSRLRVSSQSLKRAWRQSDIFKENLSGYIGIRTKEMGVQIYESLISGKKLYDLVFSPDSAEVCRKTTVEKKAEKWTRLIAGEFGKLKKESEKKKKESDTEKKDSFLVEQLVHFSPDEVLAIDSLLGLLVDRDSDPTKDELQLLRNDHVTADIAMFGRMLAGAPDYNCEAAVQVSHAITVHDTPVEDDYFTAVDDLNKGIEDKGAAHLGDAEFGAGLFYTYICVNRDVLVENLRGNRELADKALSALLESAVKVSPSGKQNSFASRAYASYLLVEKSEEQPRSLAVAFLKPVKDKDVLSNAIKAIEDTRDRIDKVYGTDFGKKSMVMNVLSGEGSLKDISAFICKP